MRLKLTIALRLFSLACLVVLASAIYRHSQRDLVVSFVLGLTALAVSVVTSQRPLTRDVLLARAQPFLEPGETPQAAFYALSGFGPYATGVILIFIVLLALRMGWNAGALAMTFMALTLTPWTVVATDRALLLLKLSMRDDEIVTTRLPRDTRIGPVSGRWATIWLNGRWMFVHRRFHNEVELADRAITLPSLVRQSEPAPDWHRRHNRISLRLGNGSRRFRLRSLHRDQS